MSRQAAVTRNWGWPGRGLVSLCLGARAQQAAAAGLQAESMHTFEIKQTTKPADVQASMVYNWQSDRVDAIVVTGGLWVLDCGFWGSCC